MGQEDAAHFAALSQKRRIRRGQRQDTGRLPLVFATIAAIREGRSMHARTLKHLEERFTWYADGIAADPCALAGDWIKKRCPGASELHLDIGCGKGSYLVEAASRNPNALYVGFDFERPCIAIAAQRVCEYGGSNAVVFQADAEKVEEFFAPGEVDVVHLNYSAPMPQKKKSNTRLTWAGFLMAYRRLLAPGGEIRLKTDSQPLYDWSLEQFELAGYSVVWQTRDLLGNGDADGLGEARADLLIGTYFEERLVGMGARVHALVAVPDREPGDWERQEFKSLVDYLPDDLESLEYVPFGMESTVENMINRRRHLARRGQ